MFHAYTHATQQAHQRLSEQVEEFLSGGGNIEEVPAGISGFEGVHKTQWMSGYTAKALKNAARQR
ncbi:hypothetical protein [Pseudomonas sichuanensis]|uniref:Transcriptional regulator SutA RNAP-binding domain-containing protein n=1 Tax=Pseudomonas sichuanensis TaxID=2213015 RepID=A0ABV0DCR8_9PSED